MIQVPSLLDHWDALAPRVEAAPRLLACFDFDGTLVGIAPRPEDVVAGPEVREGLAALARAPGTVVAVVSGRPLQSLLAQLPAGLWLVGHHGLVTAAPGGAEEPALDLEAARRALDPLRGALTRIAAGHPGTRLEDKGASLALHTRAAERGVAAAAASAFREAAAGLEGFEAMTGKEIVEVRPRGADKGSAVLALEARLGAPQLLLYAGDDTTDEDVFERLSGREDAITVRVGLGGPTRARWRLGDPGSVLDLIGRLGALRAGRNLR